MEGILKKRRVKSRGNERIARGTEGGRDEGENVNGKLERKVELNEED